MKDQKGITLIALIITIIVMLILVGVTINVALNGGLFSKADEATTKTKIAQIQEALTIKKAEVLAEYKGKAPGDYGIELNDLNLPSELKTEYGNKLIISKDGILYYNESVITNKEEQDVLKSMGINAYVNEPGGSEPGGNEPTGTTYSFKLNELGTYTKDIADSGFYFSLSNVWEAIGADLSQNSDYYYQETEDAEIMFALTSSNDKLVDAISIMLGISSIGDKTELLVMTLIDGENLRFAVVDPNEDPVLVVSPSEGQMTHETFMQLYGDDVEFSFVKISDYLQEVE